MCCLFNAVLLDKFLTVELICYWLALVNMSIFLFKSLTFLMFVEVVLEANEAPCENSYVLSLDKID